MPEVRLEAAAAGHRYVSRRIQRKRTSGWRLPDGAICVTRPGKWGNPYVAGRMLSRKRAKALFKKALLGGNLPVSVEDVRRELKGKTLACWCTLGQDCHADVLLEIANGDPKAASTG